MGLRLDFLLLVLATVIFSFKFGNSSLLSSFSLKFDLNDLNPFDADTDYDDADNETDCSGSPREIIERNGYTMVEVPVTTRDGYILTMWRICKNDSQGNSCTRLHDNKRSSKYPVLLQHGLASSGEDWLFLNRDTILPFILVENGFDVFIGNSRGSKYSMGHTQYNAQNPLSPYWKFSVHEMAVHDLPATINEIRRLTGADRVNYIGYSMGTPAMEIGNFQTQIGPLKQLIKHKVTGPLLGKVVELLFIGDGPFGMPSDQLTQILRKNVPQNLVKPIQDVESLFNKLGKLNLLEYLVSGRPLLKNSKAMECALSHSFPSGASRRTLRHYIQFFTNKGFRQYDYSNPIENLLKYKQISPLEYNMTGQTRTSIFVMEGEKDSLTVAEDIKKAFRTTHFEHCGSVAMCDFPCANHLDFVYGPNKPLKEFVYDVAVNWLIGRSNISCAGQMYLNNTDYCDSIVE